MEEKVVKKCAGKPAGKPAPKAKSSCESTKKCENKSVETSCNKKKSSSRKIAFPNKIIIDENILKNATKIDPKLIEDFTIMDLKEFGSKLFDSENKEFISLVDKIATELKKDNYGNAHYFAERKLNDKKFNGYEIGCLGSICGCITAFLVPIHIQQSKEFIKAHTR